MTNYLYRLRGSVLGKHQELENQEIFCSSLETLNDPRLSKYPADSRIPHMSIATQREQL